MTRYELLERIGAGRVAEIFRGKAVAAGGFEKPVAIKRILPHLSQDRRFVELLIAEAKVLSALRHRNIVQIFDVGVGDDGQNFLVMEFVDGIDLSALQVNLEARRQRLPVDLALHVGAEVCEALDHAQSAPSPDGQPMRLVHRDVTPSNVMVSRSGEVKLTDFGLAKRPGEGTSAGSGLRGRYGYVSPEQAAGGPVDGRSDVFAVGAIVWELATGRRLFSGMADLDALRAVREDRVAAPSEHDPTLPRELDAILAEALARDPRKRLPSAGELGKRLRGLRYSLETSTGDPGAALARLVAAVDAPLPATPRPESRPAARGKPGRRSKPSTGGFEVTTEPTIVRIRTADGFAHDPDGSGLLNARKLLDRFEEEETRLAHVLPRGLLDDGPTADRSARAAEERTVPAAPLHLDDTGDRPPLHLDDSDDDHRAAERRLRTAAASPASVRRKAAEPPIPPEPRSERRKAAAAPPPVPPTAAAAVPPTAAAVPPTAPGAPASRRRGDPSAVSAPVFGGSAAGPALAMRPDPTGARGATPTSPQVYEAPAARPRSAPPVAGFGGGHRRWWLIVAGAAVIAVISFLVTSALLESPGAARPPEPAATPDAAPVEVDAGVAVDAAAPAVDAGKPRRR